MISANRIARCICGKEQPSNSDLAFFEFRGAGSEQSIKSCKNCGYHEVAHSKSMNPNLCINKGLTFEPKGAWDYDLYYCGCRGWD